MSPMTAAMGGLAEAGMFKMGKRKLNFKKGGEKDMLSLHQ
jgi:hypothetical protein